MKRMLIALLLLVCVVVIQGNAFAQLTVVQNNGATWMDEGGVADPNQPAPDDGGGGNE